MIKANGFLAPEAFTALVDEAKNLGISVAKHAPYGPESIDLSTLDGIQSLEHVEGVFQGCWILNLTNTSWIATLLSCCNWMFL